MPLLMPYHDKNGYIAIIYVFIYNYNPSLVNSAEIEITYLSEFTIWREL